MKEKKKMSMIYILKRKKSTKIVCKYFINMKHKKMNIDVWDFVYIYAMKNENKNNVKVDFKANEKK